MQSLNHYKLFLFDFDGLLVNTEEIHFLAYQRMCHARGYPLDWDFERYCQAAHYNPTGLRDHIYSHFPELHQKEPNWDILYAEKKQAVCNLVSQGAVQLMPGVERFLKRIQELGATTCVVTNSPEPLVNLIRYQNPVLEAIPHWLTREHYVKPKPDPEGYLKAIELFAKENDSVIGFEDTPRGLTALMGTRADSVIICKTTYPEIPTFLNRGAHHFHSFEELIEKISC